MKSADSSNKPVQNGTVHIKDGQVYVANPDPGGEYAVIIPCTEIECYVDGKLIQEETKVTAENCIKLVGREIPGEYSFNISVDKDKMHAYLSIKAAPGIKYSVKDVWPARERVTIAGEVSVIPPAITEEEVNADLRQKGIVYGIDAAAVKNAVRKCPEEEILIAQGKEVQKGQDARIEPCFREGEFLEKRDDALWVDNFDYGTIASVEAGKVIARKIPAQPGKPGMDVTGRKLDPPGVQDVQLKAGPGAELLEGGMAAVAKVNGRPQLKGCIATVTPVYKVNGDVDKKTGNVNFAGDVVVEGNVLDAMKVRAGNRVKIKGYVTHCQVEAGGDVQIGGNAISCKIKAGGARVDLFPVREILSRIVESFEELAKILRQFFADPRITGRPEVKRHGPGAVLKIILDTKFAGFTRDLQELDRVLAASTGKGLKQYDDSLCHLAGEMKQKFCGSGPLEFRSVEEMLGAIKGFAVRCGDSLESVQEILQQKASISLSYAQHSTLEATGEVIIKGKGCFSTDIVSGGDVIARDKKSFFRGGHIKSEGNVEIYEVGSPGGATTIIEIPADKAINATVIHPGVTIRQGGRAKIVGEKVGDL